MENSTKVITSTNCRLSFPHLFEPASINGSEPKYSACIIIPKSDKATLPLIKAAVETAVKEGMASKWKGRKPANLKLPLRDGDTERPDDPAFADSYFINANSKRRPGVVDRMKRAIMDPEEVYPGCYCRFSINFYPFSASGNNGVAAGLNNIQFARDGERLGGGSTPDQDFDVIDDFNNWDEGDLPFDI